jgi:hypothetical protein
MSNRTAAIAQPSSGSIIEQSIPGFSGLTSSATSIINNLLSGGASTGPSQNATAKYGVRTGMPGSGVSNAFGYDLHNKRGDEMRQRGIDDLLKLVTGYSGTVNATPGELLNNSMALAQLNQASYSANADRNLATRKLNDAKDLALKNMNAGWIGQGPLAKQPQSSWTNSGSSGSPVRYIN